ncbi:hypothetical protein J7337_004993 [Fusarium musae]|uniref:Protein kinase domain-containing protein n=1 Tax=Fusarium musae TaxID=1042133 RepID=A0A9P8DHW7_9HYPO|nr:hypothetical protein J7337_004993 [Fusarium musae]KAG9502168.1 hypothetical protein J7337_004993 [Fusarium musae]
MADHDIVHSFKSTIGSNLQGSYAQVHVLLIAWEDHDVGDVDGEIRDLRALFEQDYHYSSVAFFRIPVKGPSRARLNREISSFVEEQSFPQDSLIIVYYAGHCSPDAQGQAEWAAFELGGPTVSWHVTQQLLFSAPGDVLLILDCCHASLITRGSKDGDGRFELIAASAKGAKTPVLGRRSLTRAPIRPPKENSSTGIPSENLASELREDPKVTGKTGNLLISTQASINILLETPVFHDFVRKSPTKIFLQPLQPPAVTEGFVKKPSGYLVFRASLSDDVTGLQIATWLKTAPPKNVTAVSIEAIVSRARRIQDALKDGAFPQGSVFEQLSKPARDEIVKGIRRLNTTMAATEEYAKDYTTRDENEVIQQSLVEIHDRVSTLSTAIETPLLLDTVGSRSPESTQETPDAVIMAAVDVDAALHLRKAIMNQDPSGYSREISRDKILESLKRSSSTDNLSGRFKMGSMDGRFVIMETYKYRESEGNSGEPQPQTLQEARKITGLLCHPKRKEFHILPCAGFFRDRLRKEIGIVFWCPPMFGTGSKVVTLLQLYKMHRLVPLGQRIHLTWAVATAIENFHRVGWVHKSIRSDNIAFTEPGIRLSDEDADSPFVDRFDFSKPLLFGFEYSRADDEATYLEEDYSLNNNLYRHPDRWVRPRTRFEKGHDVYSLGVVLLEIAQWEEATSMLKSFLETKPLVPSDVVKALIGKCGKSLSHQVGRVFAQCIVTCLDFPMRTKSMSEYEMQRHFQRNVTELLGRAVSKV